jgi:AcrR family transcriptional regulator
VARDTRDVSARRRTPVQARSRATYERVLDATLAILDEEGWDGLSTNAVAARAGLTVPTVYSYFPDKYAIVHELFERYEHDRRESLGPALRAAAERGDWEGALRSALTGAAEMRMHYRGGLALRQAMIAVPDLRRFEEASSSRAVAAFSGLLRAWEPRLAPEDADRAAEVVVFGTRPLIDLARRTGCLDQEFLDEAVRMTLLYLRDVIARAGVPGGAGAGPTAADDEAEDQADEAHEADEADGVMDRAIGA